MVSECNHAASETLFCPNCGEPVGGPLVSLLAHCRKQLHLQTIQRQQSIDAWVRTFGEKATITEKEESRRVRRDKAVAKWTAWVAALEKHLEEE